MGGAGVAGERDFGGGLFTIPVASERILSSVPPCRSRDITSLPIPMEDGASDVREPQRHPKRSIPNGMRLISPEIKHAAKMESFMSMAATVRSGNGIPMAKTPFLRKVEWHRVAHIRTMFSSIVHLTTITGPCSSRLSLPSWHWASAQDIPLNDLIRGKQELVKSSD